MDIWLGLLGFAAIMGIALFVAFSTMFTPIDDEDEGGLLHKDQ